MFRYSSYAAGDLVFRLFELKADPWPCVPHNTCHRHRQHAEDLASHRNPWPSSPSRRLRLPHGQYRPTPETPETPIKITGETVELYSGNSGRYIIPEYRSTMENRRSDTTMSAQSLPKQTHLKKVSQRGRMRNSRMPHPQHNHPSRNGRGYQHIRGASGPSSEWHPRFPACPQALGSWPPGVGIQNCCHALGGPLRTLQGMPITQPLASGMTGSVA